MDAPEKEPSDAREPDPPGSVVICPECGGKNDRRRRQCWLCEVPLPEDLASTRPAAKAPSSYTFGLSSLLMIVTVIAVCLGAFSIAPGSGILLAILATPALIRTMGIVRQRSARGRGADVEFKIGAFLTSILVVTAIGVAAGATFFATCFVGFMGGIAGSEVLGVGGYDSLGFGFLVGVVLGIVAGLLVAILLIRRLWPARKS